MNKISCASQNTEAKIFPTDVCNFSCFERLSPATIHLPDCRFESGVKWSIHVSSIVKYLRKNSFLVRWNSCKQQIRCCFWSTVIKRGTQFEHSILIDKCWCKIVNIPPSVTLWVGYMHIHVYTPVCLCTHTGVHVRVYIYIYIYTPTHMCVHTNTYTYTHTYTHIYMWQDELDSTWVSNFKCQDNSLTRLRKSR